MCFELDGPPPCSTPAASTAPRRAGRALRRGGHHAIALDYFGRTAGVEERGEDFDWNPHVAATTIEGTYPGAPHSFFDRKQEEFAEASTDAWTRTLDFLAAEPVEA